MSDLSSFVQGLSSSIDGYLKQKQSNQLSLQQNQAAFNQQQQQNAQTFGQQPDLTPDMAESMIPGSSKWVQAFQQQNGRLPKMSEAADSLKMIQQTLENQTKDDNKKPPVQHYIGNSPKGDAIFADNDGNMITPDKKAYTGVVLPKSSTLPTAATRSSAEFATTILPHIQEMRGLIQQADKAGYIGPTSGRVYNQFMAGKIGSTGDPQADQLLGRLRAMDSLLKTGAMRVHFGSRGGANMYDHFSDMLNTGKQSAAQLNGTLDTLQEFMQGYSQAGQPQGSIAPSPVNNKDPLGIL